MALAKETNTPVLYTEAELPLEVEQPFLPVTAPEVVQLKQVPVKAIQPTGETVEVAAVVTPPPAVELTPDPEPTQLAAVLPQTSSLLPLIAMLGLLALGGGLTLRIMQKRML
jgi:hypothetical protein